MPHHIVPANPYLKTNRAQDSSKNTIPGRQRAHLDTVTKSCA